jgi:hypothetical protein
MMKSAILATLVASAAAFAPAQQKSSSTALSADFSKEIGSQAPVSSMKPKQTIALLVARHNNMNMN